MCQIKPRDFFIVFPLRVEVKAEKLLKKKLIIQRLNASLLQVAQGVASSPWTGTCLRMLDPEKCVRMITGGQRRDRLYGSTQLLF